LAWTLSDRFPPASFSFRSIVPFRVTLPPQAIDEIICPFFSFFGRQHIVSLPRAIVRDLFRTQFNCMKWRLAFPPPFPASQPSRISSSALLLPWPGWSDLRTAYGRFQFVLRIAARDSALRSSCFLVICLFLFKRHIASLSPSRAMMVFVCKAC